MTILRFDSPAQIGRHMQVQCLRKEMRGYTNERAFAKAISGDDTLVPEAEKLLHTISELLPLPERSFQPSVYGAYPIVPEAISGYPMPMRLRTPDPNEGAPIAFYFGISPNSSVTQKQIAKYGVCVLALVWALSLTRPVSLHTIEYSSPGGNAEHGRDGEVITVCRIETQPLDLASACHALTSASYAREVCFPVATAAGGNGYGYPHGYDPSLNSRYMQGLRKRLGIEEEAVIFPSLHSFNDEAISDPERWMRRHIAKYTNGEFEDGAEEASAPVRFVS